MADSITTLQPDNTLVTFIQNTEPLIGVIEPDVDIINITTESTLNNCKCKNQDSEE